MDGLGKERGDLRKRRLDLLSDVLGPIRFPARSRSFRVLLVAGYFAAGYIGALALMFMKD